MGSINWKSLGFDFGDWDERKVWDIDIPTVRMGIQDFLWHFEVPYWTSDDGEEFSISPWDVIQKKPGSENEQNRVTRASLDFPLDVLFHNNKWFVLDGVHRLVKAYLNGQKEVSVRVFPNERLGEILTRS